MSDYDTFVAQLKDWSNRQDWSDDLVASFIVQADQRLNADMRVREMIATAENLVNCQCATLPDDWLEMDMLWIASGSTPTGWWPLRYLPRDEFFRFSAMPYASTYPSSSLSTLGKYTIEGSTLWFGGMPDAVNGVTYRMAYYQAVPAMAVTGSSWVYTKYPRIYLLASLINADFHAVGEEDKAMLLGQEVDKMIGRINDNWKLAKASGSRLARSKVRSFG